LENHRLDSWYLKHQYVQTYMIYYASHSSSTSHGILGLNKICNAVEAKLRNRSEGMPPLVKSILMVDGKKDVLCTPAAAAPERASSYPHLDVWDLSSPTIKGNDRLHPQLSNTFAAPADQMHMHGSSRGRSCEGFVQCQG
jgi:hypothetical protein